jgi:hypothetical protein
MRHEGTSPRSASELDLDPDTDDPTESQDPAPYTGHLTLTTADAGPGVAVAERRPIWEAMT